MIVLFVADDISPPPAPGPLSAQDFGFQTVESFLPDGSVSPLARFHREKLFGMGENSDDYVNYEIVQSDIPAVFARMRAEKFAEFRESGEITPRGDAALWRAKEVYDTRLGTLVEYENCLFLFSQQNMPPLSETQIHAIAEKLLQL